MQVPEAQHVAPDHPIPPHCPYSAEQLPPDDGAVELVAGAELVVVPVPVPVPEVPSPTVIEADPVLKYPSVARIW